MIPKTMRKPVWLVPLCISDLTLGLLFLLVITVPEFTPEMRERAVRHGVTWLIFGIAAINITAPVTALLFHCRASTSADQDRTGYPEP
jgi:hypothetical protein